MGASVWANAGLVPKSECKQGGWFLCANSPSMSLSLSLFARTKFRSRLQPRRIGLLESARIVCEISGRRWHFQSRSRLDFQTEIPSKGVDFRLRSSFKKRFVAGKRACSADKIEGVGRRRTSA